MNKQKIHGILADALKAANATFAGTFDVKAASESEAEEIVRDRFAAEDIKVCDLELDGVEVNAAEAG